MHDATLIGLSPVTQRAEGWPFGECVRAAYAALLDLPIEEVPRFDPASLRPGETQRDRERAWLASLRRPEYPRGLRLIEVTAEPDENGLPQRVLDQVPPVEHLISGLSPRGFGHRCVGWGGAVLWDPHPSRAGLVTVYSIGFLEPR